MEMPGMTDSTEMSNTDMDNGMNGMEGGMGGMSMVMTFNFMMPFQVVFDGWLIHDQATLIGSCFGVVGLSILYEIMKTSRLLYERTAVDQLKKINRRNDEQQMSDNSSSNSFNPRKMPQFWLHHCFQSFTHMVQVFLAYLLMLIVMTFNVWLVVSACIGSGVGYLIAGSMLAPRYSTDFDDQASFHRKGKVQPHSSNKTSFSDGDSLSMKPPAYDNTGMM